MTTTSSSYEKIFTAFIAVIIVALIALVNGKALEGTFKPGGWYDSLHKSPLTPPNWLFGVAWLILYVGLAIVYVGINWSNINHQLFLNVLIALLLVLNFMWSFFFAGQNAVLAMLVLMLSIVIGVIIITRLYDRPILAIIITLYVAWILYACYLNLYIVLNN